MTNKVSIIDKMQQSLLLKGVKKVFHNILGVDKADKGRYKEALNEFTAAIELNPKDAAAYFNRATLKVRSGDLKGASLDFGMSAKCHRDAGFKFANYPLL